MVPHARRSAHSLRCGGCLQSNPVSASAPAARAADGHPELRTLLAIGGVDMKTQADQVRNQGVHMVVATPGRLKDMLT